MQNLKWKHQPQEKEGTYRFSGRFVVTKGVLALLSEPEIMLIYWQVKHLVVKHDGLDYLQVFIDEKSGQKLFFIDQLNDAMKPEHPEEHDYCTLLLAQEY